MSRDTHFGTKEGHLQQVGWRDRHVLHFRVRTSVKKAVRDVEHAISAFISHTMSLAQARAEAAERLERIDMVLLIDAMILSFLPESLDDGI
jgi:hypothetical protein